MSCTYPAPRPKVWCHDVKIRNLSAMNSAFICQRWSMGCSQRALHIGDSIKSQKFCFSPLCGGYKFKIYYLRPFAEIFNFIVRSFTGMPSTMQCLIWGEMINTTPKSAGPLLACFPKNKKEQPSFDSDNLNTCLLSCIAIVSILCCCIMYVNCCLLHIP